MLPECSRSDPEVIMVPPLVELALDYYRKPLDYSHLADVEEPLPRGFPDLLADFNAALSSARIDETARLLSSDADELRTAAHFFIRHALLNPSADHYRSLGLNRDSSSDAVRANYQILIRMFHPDRLRDADEVDLAYSSRLNAAYRVLRDPKSRADYARGLPRRRPSSRQQDSHHYFQPHGQAMAAALRPDHLSRIGDRLKRPWLLITTLLILVTASVYWITREPEHPTLRLTKPAAEVQQQQALPQYLHGLGSAAPELEATGRPPAQPLRAAAAIPADPVTAATAAELPVGSPLSVVRAQTTTGRVELADQAAVAGSTPLPEAQASEQKFDPGPAAETLKPTSAAAAAIEPTAAPSVDLASARSPASKVQSDERQRSSEDKPSIDERVETRVQAAIAETRAPKPEPEPRSTPQPTPPAAVATKRPQPAEPQSGAQPAPPPRPLAAAASRPEPSMTAERAALAGARMVDRIERAYRSGNAAAFAALFTSDARTTDGIGRARVQRLYSDLFSASLEQSMSIRRIRWNLGPGGRIAGKGQVSVSVRDRKTGLRRQTGSIRLELVRQGDDYRVSSLFYDIN